MCNGKGTHEHGPLGPGMWMTCDACGGGGIEPTLKTPKPTVPVVTFRCDCGYTETEEDEPRGFCPMCK